MKELKPKYSVKFIDDFGHFYVIEGENERLHSVTAINKYACTPEKLDILMSWANKVMGEHIKIVLENHEGSLEDLDIDKLIKEGKGKRKEFLNKAGDIGTRLHNAVDSFFCTGKIPALDDDIQTPFQNFMSWFNKNEYKVILADTILASKQYRYGGRMDALLEDKEGNLIIVDFKTSSSISSIEYKLQLAAYRQALKETYGIDNINKGMLIRFDKEKKVFETLEVNDLDDYFKGFLAALQLKELSEKSK